MKASSREIDASRSSLRDGGARHGHRVRLESTTDQQGRAFEAQPGEPMTASHRLLEVLHGVKVLAREYYELTGRPLE